ncbi:hypothetical protein NUU61_006639 [Penicillium alfredii]|uniref:Uncharacterized protein n=1 Tax=Penicillium alfredii TaxID=1506179 RepID=A0A9W9K3J0_9EURO|nr:uncharacterized protein NUU61_006639 [Penicillium alfredii]KAJ5091769.1 hypothetical protein NUU61_006639 [Penicillium alfredii]
MTFGNVDNVLKHLSTPTIPFTTRGSLSFMKRSTHHAQNASGDASGDEALVPPASPRLYASPGRFLEG